MVLLNLHKIIKFIQVIKKLIDALLIIDKIRLSQIKYLHETDFTNEIILKTLFDEFISYFHISAIIS
jgi:hypothetical protein